MSGAVSSIQNLLHVVEDCGVRVSRVVLEPLASAEACLLDSDRESGVVLIDVGGGTTDIAAFIKGVLTHTAVIPIGGESFSADLAYGLKIPQKKAERIKLRYGTVLSNAVDPVAAVKLDDRYYNANFMSQILEYRAREVFDYVREHSRTLTCITSPRGRHPYRWRLPARRHDRPRRGHPRRAPGPLPRAASGARLNLYRNLSMQPLLVCYTSRPKR